MVSLWYHSLPCESVAAMKCQGRVRTRRRRRLALDTLGGCTLALAGARLFLAPLSFFAARIYGTAGRGGAVACRLESGACLARPWTAALGVVA
ncbi:hypothetical protein [uncultured Selenomonas sp.]|uniref:hypothetical protein n=1 Tax=uncultured Selenomonas sp. TaxID=159275 RepID=UPI0028D2D823|nr:hypothetical protein [uncultured Selenomonas sp.]